MTSIHRISEELVRLNKILRGLMDFPAIHQNLRSEKNIETLEIKKEFKKDEKPIDQGRETSPAKGEMRIGRGADIDDLESNVLALAIAVEPEDKPLAAASLILEGAFDVELVVGDGLADRRLEEVGGVAGMPLAESIFEFDLHEVAGDGGDEHLDGNAIDGVRELEDLVVTGMAFPHAEALVVAGEDGGDRLRHRRLLRHVQSSDAPTAAGHLQCCFASLPVA